MEVERIIDQVVLISNGEIVERMSPEDALLMAANLTTQSDHILKAIAKLDVK